MLQKLGWDTTEFIGLRNVGENMGFRYGCSSYLVLNLIIQYMYLSANVWLISWLSVTSRALRSVDICLWDATTNLLLGRGLLFSHFTFLSCLYQNLMFLKLILCNINCSDEHGDRPRPLPVIKELAGASDVTDRKESPSWDFDVSWFSSNYFITKLSFSGFILPKVFHLWSG